MHKGTHVTIPQLFFGVPNPLQQKKKKANKRKQHIPNDQRPGNQRKSENCISFLTQIHAQHKCFVHLKITLT